MLPHLLTCYCDPLGLTKILPFYIRLCLSKWLTAFSDCVSCSYCTSTLSVIFCRLGRAKEAKNIFFDSPRFQFVWKIKTTTTVTNADGCKCGMIGIWAGKNSSILTLRYTCTCCTVKWEIFGGQVLSVWENQLFVIWCKKSGTLKNRGFG